MPFTQRHFSRGRRASPFGEGYFKWAGLYFVCIHVILPILSILFKLPGLLVQGPKTREAVSIPYTAKTKGFFLHSLTIFF